LWLVFRGASGGAIICFAAFTYSTVFAFSGQNFFTKIKIDFPLQNCVDQDFSFSDFISGA
jgi:hypothetical protein